MILSRCAAVVEVLAPAELFLMGKVLGAGDFLVQKFWVPHGAHKVMKKENWSCGIAPAGPFLWGKVLGAGDLLEKRVEARLILRGQLLPPVRGEVRRV